MRKKGGKVSLKSREWVLAKKERRRRQGKGYENDVTNFFHLNTTSQFLDKYV